MREIASWIAAAAAAVILCAASAQASQPFIADDPQDLHTSLKTVAKPLNTLSEKELCPGSAALDKINAGLR